MNETRQRILDATARLIREYGIAPVTTKRIAAEAGCAEGTIFNHFNDKGALLASVLSFALPETHALYVTIRETEEQELRPGLLTVTEALITFYRASYPLVGSALADRTLFERYAAAHRGQGTGPQQAWQLVAGFLQRAQRRGLLSDAHDVEVEALALVGACQNAVWVEMVSGRPALPHGGDRIVERLVDSRLPALLPLALEP